MVTRQYKVILRLKKLGFSDNEIREILEVTPAQYKKMANSEEIAIDSRAIHKAMKLINENKRLDVEYKALENAEMFSNHVAEQGVTYMGNMGRNTALLKEVKSGVFELEDSGKDMVVNFILKKET